MTDAQECGCDWECGDRVISIGRQHYGICEECRVYWSIGSNLFSGWRDEVAGMTEAEASEHWELKRQELEFGYRLNQDVPRTNRGGRGETKAR